MSSRGQVTNRATAASSSAVALLGLLLAFPLCGCGSSGGSPPLGTSGTFTGDPQPLGGGTVRSVVRIENGRPQAVGVTFGEAALTGLPTDGTINQGIEQTLSLPAQGSITPFDHIAFVYLPKGRFIPGLYDVPTFAVTAFNVTQEFRAQIQTEDRDRLYRVPRAGKFPVGYFLLSESGIPRFGIYFANIESREFTGRGFTSTLAYRYFNGSLIGTEPSVALSFLNQKTTRVDEIGIPNTYPRRGYWPTLSAVRYDPATQEFTIALEGFVFRR